MITTRTQDQLQKQYQKLEHLLNQDPSNVVRKRDIDEAEFIQEEVERMNSDYINCLNDHNLDPIHAEQLLAEMVAALENLAGLFPPNAHINPYA